MSDHDEVNVMRPGMGGDGLRGGARAHEREVSVAPGRLGRSSLYVPRKLYNYDRNAVLEHEPVRIGTTFSDTLSDSEASAMLDYIHRIYGVDKAMDYDIGAFDNAFMLSYIFNGSSQLLPSQRVSFFVNDSMFELRDAMDALGIHARRFFRAFAKDNYALAKRIYEKPDEFPDGEGYRMRERMLKIAAERGVQRAPYLIFDTVEYAGLSITEATLLGESRPRVINNTYNAVDSLQVPAASTSLDNYDSTNHRRVSNDNNTQYRR